MKPTITNTMKGSAFLFLLVFAQAYAQTDPLPSWNDGAAKKAIVGFVKTTTEKGSAKFVPPEARIATFDQDGTLWVEHPMYSFVMYALERVPAVVKAKPELEKVEPLGACVSELSRAKHVLRRRRGAKEEREKS